MRINEPQTDMVQVILNAIKTQLDNDMDAVIEEKVEEFRDTLVRNKSRLVAEAMAAIEVQTQNGMLDGGYQFNIIIRPNVIIKK